MMMMPTKLDRASIHFVVFFSDSEQVHLGNTRFADPYDLLTHILLKFAQNICTTSQSPIVPFLSTRGKVKTTDTIIQDVQRAGIR